LSIKGIATFECPVSKYPFLMLSDEAHLALGHASFDYSKATLSIPFTVESVEKFEYLSRELKAAGAISVEPIAKQTAEERVPAISSAVPHSHGADIV
jgi:hypothetical protein